MHSPFVYEFINEVLIDDRNFYAYLQIENVRQQLLQDHRKLIIEDFGAGSRVLNNKQRTVSSIASTSLKPKKYSQLLFRMINYYQPKTILELGTSLGVTSSYLAAANYTSQVITMEGSLAIASVAKENFYNLGLDNIEVVVGNFDNTLYTVISKLSNIDFAFIDGNHRYSPTITYFNQLLSKVDNQTIIIFDDIHWSKEMEQAWKEVQQHPSVTLTIDLFFIGIVFLKKEIKIKQHFAIRF